MSIIVNDTNSNIYKVCVDGEKRSVAKIITSENGVKKTIYNNKYNNLLVALSKGAYLCNKDNIEIIEFENSFINITYTSNYYLGIDRNGYIHKSFDGTIWENLGRVNDSITWVSTAIFFIHKKKIFLLLNDSVLYVYEDKAIWILIWENRYNRCSLQPSISTDNEYIFMYAIGGDTITNNGSIYGNRIEIKLNINTYEVTETVTHPRTGVGGGASYNNIRCEIDTFKSNLNDIYYGNNSQYLMVLKYKNQDTTPTRHQLYNCPSIPSIGNNYYSSSLKIKHVNKIFFIFGSYDYVDSNYYPIVYSANGDDWTVDTNFQYDQYNVLEIFYHRNSYCIMSQNKENSELVFFKTNDFITFEQMNINTGSIDKYDLPNLICAAYNDDKIR